MAVEVDKLLIALEARVGPYRLNRDGRALQTMRQVARLQLLNPSEASQQITLSRIEDFVRQWGGMGSGSWMLKVAQGDDLMFLQAASARKQ